MTLRASSIIGLIGATGSALSEVYEFDNGATLSVSTTAGYQVGIRAEDASPKALSPDTDHAHVELLQQVPVLPPYDVSTHTPRSYNFDDPNRNFEKGDLITNALNALMEVNFKYEDYGFKVSGNAYYDFVYHSANSNEVDYPDGINKTSGAADHFAGETRYANGGRFRALDFFAYGTFHPFDTNLSLRVGNQVVAWGESLFFGNIAVTQGPADATRANTPGAEVKDILLPVPQVSMNWGVTDRLSILGYYQLDWEKNQLDGVGSYFSRADVIGPGAEFAYGSVNPFPDIIGYYASACTLSPETPGCASFGLPSQLSQVLADVLSNQVLGIGDETTGRFDTAYAGEDKPNNAAQWGIGLRYILTDNLATGLYFLKYAEKNPLPILSIATLQSDPARNGTVLGAVSDAVCGALGADCGGLASAVEDGIDSVVAAVAPLYMPFEYRAKYFDDVKLYGVSASASIGQVNFGFEFAYRQDAPMLVNSYITGIKAPQPVRGDIWQANLNALYVMSGTEFWDTLTLVAEASVNHVTHYDTLYLYDKDGQPLRDGNGNNINAFRGLTGDRTSWGIQGLAEFGYTDIFPGGWDMSIPVIFGIAFGTPAYSGALGTLSGSGDVRLASGVKFRYLNNLEISLMYNGFFGSYSPTERPLTDRDYVVATVKYSF